MLPFLPLASFFILAKAVPQATSSSDCVGTISSLNDVSSAIQCKTVNINTFTVPAGQTFSLNLLKGTTVNVLGDIQFANQSWSGPLFEINGKDITFNGNNHRWDGGGPFYWDGGGSVTKPDPMMAIYMSGTFSNVYAVNSPKRCFAISNQDPLVVSSVTVDDSQGNYPTANSNGHPAGCNTDGFDISEGDVVIKHCVVINQDDCFAINSGRNIVIEYNHCNSGHGISIGSIQSNAVVENVVIRGNEVVNSMQAFRIKTHKDATNSRVTNVSYSGNVAKNCTEYGILVTQSYPETFGTPGNGVEISNINFSEQQTDVDVASDAKTAAVNCGSDSCHGWDWSMLQTSGGEGGEKNNCPSINGYSI